MTEISPDIIQHLYDEGFANRLENIVVQSDLTAGLLSGDVDVMLECHGYEDLSFDQIKEVQKCWKLLGLYEGEIDGYAGGLTDRAYRKHTAHDQAQPTNAAPTTPANRGAQETQQSTQPEPQGSYNVPFTPFPYRTPTDTGSTLGSESGTQRTPREEAYRTVRHHIYSAEFNGLYDDNPNLEEREYYDLLFGRQYPQVYNPETRRLERVPATELTFDQINEAARRQTRQQRENGAKTVSAAAGAGQVITTTRDSVRVQLGLKGTDLFNQENQDAINDHLMDNAGLDLCFLGAQSPEKTANNLSNTWMSLKNSRGGNALNGYNGNHAYISYSSTLNTVRRARNTYFLNTLDEELRNAGYTSDFCGCYAEETGITPSLKHDIGQFFLRNPDALTRLTPDAQTMLMNLGPRETIVQVVHDNPNVQRHVHSRVASVLYNDEGEKRALNRRDLLRSSNQGDLIKLQTGLSMLGEYTYPVIDGRGGTSTNVAYANYTPPTGTGYGVLRHEYCDEDVPSQDPATSDFMRSLYWDNYESIYTPVAAPTVNGTNYTPNPSTRFNNG